MHGCQVCGIGNEELHGGRCRADKKYDAQKRYGLNEQGGRQQAECLKSDEHNTSQRFSMKFPTARSSASRSRS
jgi:hypothetical protein